MSLLFVDGNLSYAVDNKTGKLHYIRDGVDLGEIDFGGSEDEPEPVKESRFTFNKNDLNTQIINPDLAGKIGCL